MVLKHFTAAISIFAALASVSYAQIAVPDYSFTGKEITGFIVKPGYTGIDFKFQPPSKMDVYLQKRKAEFGSADKKNYKSDEPSFMYSTSAGTSLSSIFVGETAYRNNVVKAFLNGDFIAAIEAYTKYKDKLQPTIFFDEVTLLYALSLYETGSRRQSLDVLTALAVKDNEYAELAQDKLFADAASIGRYDVAEAVVPKIVRFSPYGAAIWLEYLNSRDRYADIIAMLDRTNVEEQYTDFTKLRAMALYFIKRYADVTALADKLINTEVLPLLIDSYILTGKMQAADALISEMPDSEVRSMLGIKSDIAKNEFSKASIELSEVVDEKEKLSLFFYAVSTRFKDLPVTFLESFYFKDVANNDYVNYYLGLKYLSMKRYGDAVKRLSLITFNKDLLISSYFYQGMAGIHTDASRAEWNFMRYIGAGTDQELLMLSKFMLSQLYFMKKSYDDALMLVDDCAADYCARLKADIFLAQGKYESSVTAAKGLKDERSALIRATSLYNQKKYEQALKELRSITKTSAETDFLLMMCYFKLQNFKDADKIFKKNMDDPRVFSAGVDQLILTGEGKTALAYLDGIKDLAPAYRIERGKLLLMFKRTEEAKNVFESLIKDETSMYEAALGLLQIAQAEKKEKEFLAEFTATMAKSAKFDNKDQLASQFAAYALELGDPNSAISYVNYFMENHQNSPYVSDVFRTRARLYLFTGRYNNCIADADKIIAEGKEGAADALFLKAECTEFVDKNKALEIYRKMSGENDRFFSLANNRITMLSDEAGEVLEASIRMRNVSDDIFRAGVIRFFEISTDADLIKFRTAVDRFTKTGAPDIRSAAYWRIGKNYNEAKNYPDAVRYYMKGYYLFPKEKFALATLKGAADSYKTLGMMKETEIITKMIATLEKQLPKDQKKKITAKTATAPVNMPTVKTNLKDVTAKEPKKKTTAAQRAVERTAKKTATTNTKKNTANVTKKTAVKDTKKTTPKTPTATAKKTQPKEPRAKTTANVKTTAKVEPKK